MKHTLHINDVTSELFLAHFVFDAGSESVKLNSIKEKKYLVIKHFILLGLFTLAIVNSSMI